MKMTILINDFLLTAFFERKDRRFIQECRDALNDLLDVTGDIEMCDMSVELIKKFIKRENRCLKRRMAVQRYIIIRAFVNWANGSPLKRRTFVYRHPTF
jgi:hypothetical protein